MKKTTARKKASWFPAPPIDIQQPYLLGNYDVADVSKAIAAKYLDRSQNLQRAWSRICTHLPESHDTSKPLKIIEFSTAHGAMLEIWNKMGHVAEGTDYCVPIERSRSYRQISDDNEIFHKKHDNPVERKQQGWIYQPIIESIGAKVHLFDASEQPYPFEDKSYDYLCCYQAIEAYAKPAEWSEVVSEFCRIARKAVIIGFNPPPRKSVDGHSWEETKEAWEKLRTYNANGFRNAFFEFHETNRGYHPSACKLVCAN